MQALHLLYWGSSKSYFKFNQWCFQSQCVSWELLRSTWCPTELSTPGNPHPRLSGFSLQTLLFSGSILVWLSRPLSLFMQIYCLFIASGIHHGWPHVLCSEVMCHEHLPAQPLRQRAQSRAGSETLLGSFVRLPNASWMWTGSNSSCKPGPSTPACSWWSVWVYPTGKNHVLHRHLVIKQNMCHRVGTSS